MRTIEIHVVKKCDLATSTWAGGTTTQLAIYPTGADYKLRAFRWRISTAVVEGEESVFTSLPGVHRHLMILKGRIRLLHEGRREVELGPFDIDEFEGDWHTRSFGRCVDFNLMTHGAEGRLGTLSTHSPTPLRLFDTAIDQRASEAWECFYCLVPNLALKVEEGDQACDILLNQGDILTLHCSAPDKDNSCLSWSSTDEATPYAVRAEIWI